MGGWRERDPGERGHMCDITDSHVGQQELTPHCKAIILQFKTAIPIF